MGKSHVSGLLIGDPAVPNYFGTPLLSQFVRLTSVGVPVAMSFNEDTLLMGAMSLDKLYYGAVRTSIPFTLAKDGVDIISGSTHVDRPELVHALMKAGRLDVRQTSGTPDNEFFLFYLPLPSTSILEPGGGGPLPPLPPGEQVLVITIFDPYTATQTAFVNTPFDYPLDVVVTDAFTMLPVQGVLVTYNAPATGPSCTFSVPGGSYTDIFGHASVVATANGNAGTYDVAVTTPDAPTPAFFHLINRV